MSVMRERALLFLREAPGALPGRLRGWLEDDGFVVEPVPSLEELKQAVHEGTVGLIISRPPQSVRDLSALMRLAQRSRVPLIFGDFDPPGEGHKHLRPWPCAWLGNGDAVARAIGAACSTRDAIARRLSPFLVAGGHELDSLSGSSRPAGEQIASVLALCAEAIGAREATLHWSPWTEHRLRDSLEDELPSPRGPLARLSLLAMTEARGRYVLEEERGKHVERFAIPIFGTREVEAVLCVERRAQEPVGRAAQAFLARAADRIGQQLERWRIADVLEHRERLAGLGEHMASVVHELNSPLSYVRSNLESLHQILASPTPLSTAVREDAICAVDESITGMVRMSELIAGIRAGSRVPKSAHEPVDLSWVARRAAEQIRGIGGQRTLNVRLELSRTPLVMADAGRLLQVAQNLLVNAAQASGVGGRIVLRTGCMPDRAFLDVVDDGPGVPAELEDRIFEPFFTTKSSDTGTGLGLAICRRIAREHGGDVSYFRATGAGACFRLSLPVEHAGSSPSTSDA